jgi:hypothetical protein
MRKYLCCAGALVIVACSSPSIVQPISVPLQYKVQAKAVEFPTLPSCASVSDIRVTDSRDRKAL